MREASTAVVTIVRGRLGHLAVQRWGLALQDVDHEHVVVQMGGEDPSPVLGPTARVVRAPLPTGPDAGRLPLAAARNLGAASTDADVLVFLDVDCVPAPGALRQYVGAAEHHGGLLCGPVGHLPPGATEPTPDVERLTRLAEPVVPTSVRPWPPAGDVVDEDRYELFWSLSFALRRSDFEQIGGFCEDYCGYGAEDTDFAFGARAAGVPMRWVGGAVAWHQHHPTSSPPRQHLADIVRNADVFRRRWGTWPMEGWLEVFADEGLVEWDPAGDRLRAVTGSRHDAAG